MVNIRRIFLAVSLLIASPVLLANGRSYDSGSVDGFIGYRNDLDLKLSTTLSKEKENGSGTYLGINISYSSEYFVLNSFIRSNSINGENAVVETLSASKTFSLSNGSELGITVGDLVIPFGLYETQRLYPSVLSQRSLNDSIFSEVADSSIIQPSNVGILTTYTKKSFTYTAAVYFPSKEQFTLVKSDFTRLRFDRRTRIPLSIPQNDKTITGISLDLRNFEAGNPSTISDPVEVTVTNVELTKRSVFFGLTYDNRNNTILDLEIIHSHGKTDDKSVQMDETYYYIGAERLINKLSLKGEAAYFQSRSAREYKVTALSYGFTYDMGDTVLIGTSIRTHGILKASDLSLGVIRHLGKNVFVRVLYRDVKARLETRRFLLENSSCFSTLSRDCADPTDGFILPERQSEDVSVQSISNRGIEARIIWFF